MTIRRLTLFALLLAAVAVARPAAAQMSYGKAPRLNKEPGLPTDADGKSASRIDQKLGEKVPLDVTLFDHDGKETRLGDCLQGKPTVLVLAYFSCPKLCTEVLNGLVGEMKKLSRIGLTAGRDYNVVTVGINPKEGPDFVFVKRQSYLAEYDKRPMTETGWWFLTASKGQGTDVLAAEEKVRALAAAVGFHYAADNHTAYEQAKAESDPVQARVKLETAIRRTKDYVHPSAVMVLTPDGTISQYFHGMPRIGPSPEGEPPLEQGYTAEDLRLALEAANGGKIGSPLTRAMVTCFAYDVEKGNYRIATGAMGIVAGVFVFVVGGIVAVAVRQARREKRSAAAA